VVQEVADGRNADATRYSVNGGRFLPVHGMHDDEEPPLSHNWCGWQRARNLAVRERASQRRSKKIKRHYPRTERMEEGPLPDQGAPFRGVTAGTLGHHRGKHRDARIGYDGAVG